jgi:ribosome assembly protein RRB1
MSCHRFMQKVRVYDTRDRNKAQIALEAHAADVNVISWNALTTFMLVSGGDDAHMKVWDLRALDSHVADFNYHSAPITSIEWCPHESSMLATCAEVRSQSRSFLRMVHQVLVL